MTTERGQNSLFFATSFSGKVDYATGLVLPEFRTYVESILEPLRTLGGFSVFCAIEHEGWKMGNEPPEIGLGKDLDEIRANDTFLALLDANSAGLHYEIAYANSYCKRVILATPPDVLLNYIGQGLVGLNLAQHIPFTNGINLTQQIKN